MIFPYLAQRSGPPAVTLQRAPLEYAPRSTTAFNYERLNAADPNLQQMNLRYVDVNVSPDDWVFIEDFAFEAILLVAVQAAAAPLLALAYGPLAVAALWILFPAIVVGGTLLTKRRLQVRWLGVLFGGFVLTALSTIWLQSLKGTSEGFVIWLLIAAVTWLEALAWQAVLYRWRMRAADPHGSNVNFAPSRRTRLFNRLMNRSATASLLLGVGRYVVIGVLMWMAISTNVAATLASRVLSFLHDWQLLAWMCICSAPIAVFSWIRLKTSWWPYFLHDPGILRAPGMWIGSRLTTSSRRSLLATAIGAFQLALVFGLLPPQAPTADRLEQHITSVLFDNPVAGHSVLILAFVGAFIAALVGTLLVIAPPLLLDWLLAKNHVDPLGLYLPRPIMYNARLRQSSVVLTDADGREVRECDHIYFGFEPHQRFPILLHRTLLHEHVYIVGDSGSGKTSLGLIPLITFLLGAAPANP